MNNAQSLPPDELPNAYPSQNDKIRSEECRFRYATVNMGDLNGPDQVLPADADFTSEASGRVRIKLNEGDQEPLSIPGVLMRTTRKYPDRIAMVSRADKNGHRKTYTYREYERTVRTVAKAFIKLGLERFHAVCILGFNSPEWAISEIAAIYAGGIVTGIYTTNSPEACRHCAVNSRANIIVVDDEKQLAKILQIKKDLPLLKAIVQYEGTPTEPGVLSWEELLEIGQRESDDKLEAVLKTICVNECSQLVYTSGTVGKPKGVMLSHDNILIDAMTFSEQLGFKEAYEVVVSFLPLSHVAAQVVDIFMIMITGGTAYFADKNALKGTLINTLLEARPTAFLAVPRVWEKIYEKMQQIARNNGTIKTWIANWAKAQGLYYNMNKMNGVDYKHWGYLFAKWLVFDKIKMGLGFDRCRVMASAAAPLNFELKKYFLSIDIMIFEAYGMSETSGGHVLATPKAVKLEAIGKTLKGFRTKLDNIDDKGVGEICMSGRNIFMGYLAAPEKTAEVFDNDGFVHSGDLGKIDKDGFVYVTGRTKELIITAGGENIPPFNIEQTVLAELPALNYAILIGDQRKYLTMLLTLKTKVNVDTGEPLDEFDPDTLKWAKSIGSKSENVKDVLNSHDPLIYKEIEEAIKRANGRAMSNAQKIQKFRILPCDFSIVTGELGPTMKIRRNIVYEKYIDLIEDMYQENQ